MMNSFNLIAGEKKVENFVEHIRANRPITQQEASEAEVGYYDLELQLLLYLPRLIFDGQLPENSIFTEEARRLAIIIRQRTEPYMSWRKEPSITPSSPDDAIFTPIIDTEAQIIHERFHYLSSFRKNSFHFGLKTRDEHLISLTTVSPFDLNHILGQLPGIDNADTEVMVVSRVYSFDWAPRNTTSYLMSQVYKWLTANRPEVKILVTYINPNMGFTGASFRASNWLPFGYEWGTRYTYLDGLYITDRELVNQFGTADPDILHKRLGSRFETNKMWLAPLLLYIYFLDRHIARQYGNDFNCNFWRP